MKDDDFVSAKDLVVVGLYTSLSGAHKALARVRSEMGIRPYGKVTFGEYKHVFVSKSDKTCQLCENCKSKIQ